MAVIRLFIARDQRRYIRYHRASGISTSSRLFGETEAFRISQDSSLSHLPLMASWLGGVVALALLAVSSAQHIPLTFPYGVASGTNLLAGISWNTITYRVQLSKLAGTLVF